MQENGFIRAGGPVGIEIKFRFLLGPLSLL